MGDPSRRKRATVVARQDALVTITPCDHAVRHKRWWAVLLPALGLVSLSNTPVRGAESLDPFLGDPGTTLPNLVPEIENVAVFRPFVFDESSRTSVPGPPELWLETRTSNLGAAPLRLTVDSVDKPEESTVSQCMSWRENVACRAQRQVEGISWDAQTYNWPFDVFATYQLRRLLQNAKVDHSERGLLATADKTLSCITDFRRVRNDASLISAYPKCEGFVQGLSPGWADLDFQTEPGQQLSLEGQSDGTYAVVFTLDAANRLHESNDADNTVEAFVELSDGLTRAAIVGK